MKQLVWGNMAALSLDAAAAEVVVAAAAAEVASAADHRHDNKIHLLQNDGKYS